MSQVLLGEHDYNTNGETESLRMNVVQIKNHPKYDDLTTDYDFAMLKLKSSTVRLENLAMEVLTQVSSRVSSDLI